MSNLDKDRSTEVRSNSFLYWKKVLSYYMPNKNQQWNRLTGTGNPTKSQEVNDMIKWVCQYETCKKEINACTNCGKKIGLYNKNDSCGVIVFWFIFASNV